MKPDIDERMINLFGETETPAPAKEVTNRKAVEGHAKLIQLHGIKEGEKCKRCKFLFEHRCNKTYYKCGKLKTSHSPLTDHRVGWQACGLWEEDK